MSLAKHRKREEEEFSLYLLTDTTLGMTRNAELAAGTTTEPLIGDSYMTIEESNVVIGEISYSFAVAPPSTPTVKEFIESRDLTPALVHIDRISRTVFDDRAEKSNVRVGDDPVLGGYYLIVEVPVEKIEFNEYRTLRRTFDREVVGKVGPKALRHMVVMSRFDG